MGKLKINRPVIYEKRLETPLWQIYVIIFLQKILKVLQQ